MRHADRDQPSDTFARRVSGDPAVRPQERQARAQSRHRQCAARIVGRFRQAGDGVDVAEPARPAPQAGGGRLPLAVVAVADAQTPSLSQSGARGRSQPLHRHQRQRFRRRPVRRRHRLQRRRAWPQERLSDGRAHLSRLRPASVGAGPGARNRAARIAAHSRRQGERRFSDLATLLRGDAARAARRDPGVAVHAIEPRPGRGDARFRRAAGAQPPCRRRAGRSADDAVVRSRLSDLLPVLRAAAARRRVPVGDAVPGLADGGNRDGRRRLGLRRGGVNRSARERRPRTRRASPPRQCRRALRRTSRRKQAPPRRSRSRR